jgi:23S rRNA (uracil1939-C5)-methyltransferase
VPSSNATEILCPHTETCKGCSAIGDPYPVQLLRKHERLALALARHPTVQAASAATVPASEISHYRSRAKLAVTLGAKPGDACKIGLYAEGHRVVDIPECQILSQPLSRALSMIRGLLAEADILHTARLRALDLREAQVDKGKAELLLTWVLQTKALSTGAARAELLACAQHWLLQVPGLVGIAFSAHDGRSPQLLGDAPVHLAGKSAAQDSTGNTVHIATFGSFVQANRSQSAKIAGAISARMGLLDAKERRAGPRVLELYGGSGAISLALAKHGARVTLLEAYGPAATVAEAAGKDAGLRVIAAKVEDSLARLQSEGRFDWVVVNPPRKGLPKALRLLLPKLATKVAYLSCEPETLARDIAHLAELGLHAEHIQSYDMMPQTLEVETLVFLTERTVSAAAPVYEDDKLRAEVHSGWDEAARPSGIVVKLTNEASKTDYRVSYQVLARGITRRKGSLFGKGKGLYQRIEIVANHSLLRIEATPESDQAIAGALAKLQHPVLGTVADGATARHMDERYGLQRPFIHAEVLTTTEGALLAEAKLAGDLASVLHRMRAISNLA